MVLTINALKVQAGAAVNLSPVVHGYKSDIRAEQNPTCVPQACIEL